MKQTPEAEWSEIHRRAVLVALGGLGAGCTGIGDGGTADDGASTNGTPDGGASTDGTSEDGGPANGTPDGGGSSNGTEGDGGPSDGTDNDDTGGDVEATYESLEFQPTDEQFTNPGRGWVLSAWPEEYEGADELLEYGEVGYYRFTWSGVQPAPDEFNWAPLDAFLEFWDDLGLQGAFGVMAANSHSSSDQPFVTPEWVFEDGAEYERVTFDSDDPVHMDNGTAGDKVVPKFDDPVFLEHLEGFLDAVANRYDGDDRLEWLDVRSCGNWGEGHMWPFYQHFDVYEPLTTETYQRHVDRHQDAFEETQLLLNAKGADHDHRSVQEDAVGDGVGLRSDGIVGASDGSETAHALGDAPVAFEWHQGYEYLTERGWWGGDPSTSDRGFALEDCVERGKPTYVGLNQLASPDETRAFLEAERELVEQLSRRIGYRFELADATIPTTIPSGEPVELTTTWQNVGVAPIYEDVHVATALLDEAGDEGDRRWLDVDPRDWTPDESHSTTGEVTFSAADGSSRLAVGLFTDRDLATPDVRLGTDTDRVDRWHVLGTVDVE